MVVCSMGVESITSRLFVDSCLIIPITCAFCLLRKTTHSKNYINDNSYKHNIQQHTI